MEGAVGVEKPLQIAKVYLMLIVNYVILIFVWIVKKLVQMENIKIYQIVFVQLVQANMVQDVQNAILINALDVKLILSFKKMEHVNLML